MRRTYFISCLLVLFAIAAWSQAAEEPGWSKYSTDAGKFSVMMPGQPEENSSVENGVTLKTFRIIVRPRLYMVIYSDYPDADLKLETRERLNAERDGFIKNVKDGKLVSEREFKFKRGTSDLPALEFTAETPTVNYKGLIILDGRRVYFATAGSLKGNDSTTQFERFLGSFTLN